MQYFDQKGSGLCFSVDHTNRAWCHALKKTNAISHSKTLLLHPSAAPENPPSFTTEQLHETSQAISGTAQELFTQITCDFGLLWPDKGQEMGSVEEGACSPSALHKLLLWAPLPQHRLASPVRNLHPFCLLGQVNITNHVWGFFPYSFHSTFLPCSKQLMSGRPLGILKIWLQSWLWNGLNISHRFVPLLRDSRGPCLPVWQQPQDPCPPSPFHL